MLSELIIARSCLQLDHVDLVHVGQQTCRAQSRRRRVVDAVAAGRNSLLRLLGFAFAAFARSPARGLR
jgi:hypothetical protein